MSNTIISVKNLTKQYQAEQAGGIKNISFDIQRGDVVAIIGESGSGKSTLLKTIFGLLKTDSGDVFFEDKRVLGPDEQLIPGHKQMKMVTQDFSLNIYAKVYDNIASQLSNTDLKTKTEKTLAIMEHLRILHLQNKKIIELSGGEQQRVAIAKAMVSDTQVLLLDEPFSQVDALLKNQLRADIKRVASETGVTVILVSHDPADGLFLADQLLIIKDGELLQTGKPADIYQHPKHIYTAQILGNAVVLSREDAEKIGLKTALEFVVFYPEWAEINNSWNSRRFEVKDVYYKGFYDELLVERKGVNIRALQLNRGEHKKNDHVQLNISHFLEF
ncbi:ABC transporter ATP-binding protein [Pedobacter rhizosphaerae]|uniref:ABC-type Fe3+/spermidine/putrescine transport systems, ATPase components n=1 Tax=Pedobacter rhizosphaerae TaxID=390241 RepID=A0A1H9NS87_9SPHI|nr:ABC transporter ATP-binding protein [Pedobacter rhizosphaerae]SER38761.1 ABC-type Fe3+/spermidine/putrescine transport systems, ATPase components [Pedobacter rhizosphaerae]